MNEKEMYCRIQGYQLAVHSIDEIVGKYWVSSGDWEAYQALNLNFVDRGWYDGRFSESDIDCIWTEQNYKVVEVLKGELRVSEKTYEQRNKPVLQHRRFFAIYNGHKYLNVQGVNNKFIFKLASYDFSSQDDGFIMYRPGLFIKYLKRNELELAFFSDIWCRYKGFKFAVSGGDGTNYLIDPYSRDDYSNSLLKSLGWEDPEKNFRKEVHIDELSDIWIINRSTDGFQVEMKPEIIKGSIY